MNGKSSKRVVTSAIEGMTVAEVRKGLDVIRSCWKSQQSADNSHAHDSFHLCNTIFNGMTIQDFCFQFTLGHHHKRHAKSKKAKQSSVNK